MAVPKNRLLDGWYHGELIVHLQRYPPLFVQTQLYRPSDSNELIELICCV